MGCVQSDIATQQSLQSNLCIHNTQSDILEKYILDTKIGEGAFGAVYIAINKETDERYALKILKLSRGNNAALRKEIDVWRGLQHPNIVRIFETYEDSKNMYMVMELCSGGRILEKLQQQGCGYSEDFVRMTVRKIASAICYLHSHRICHRDLKLEHLLFESENSDADIKICDFGASTKIQQGENMHTVLGTMFYMAPEVLRGEYHEACDLWSLGVIMYMMLSNKAPFHGENDDQLVKSVMTAEVSFAAPVWNSISSEAKSLLQRLLNRNATKRYSASQVLRHPWLGQHRISVQPLDSEAMSRMTEFCSAKKLKQIGLLTIAFSLSASETSHLRTFFYDSIESSDEGVLSVDDFYKAIQRYGYSKELALEMFECIDQDRNKDIDFLEFVAATIESKFYQNEEQIQKAFELIDKQNLGYIDKRQLNAVLGPVYTSKEVTEILESVNTIGRVNLKEFIQLIKGSSKVDRYKIQELKKEEEQNKDFNENHKNEKKSKEYHHLNDSPTEQGNEQLKMEEIQIGEEPIETNVLSLTKDIKNETTKDVSSPEIQDNMESDTIQLNGEIQEEKQDGERIRESSNNEKQLIEGQQKNTIEQQVEKKELQESDKELQERDKEFQEEQEERKKENKEQQETEQKEQQEKEKEQQQQKKQQEREQTVQQDREQKEQQEREQKEQQEREQQEQQEREQQEQQEREQQEQQEREQQERKKEKEQKE